MIPEFTENFEPTQFTAQKGARPIITAFDFDYSTPLAFMYNSPSLLLKDHDRHLLSHPLSLLDAVVAGLADPLAYAPHIIESTAAGASVPHTALVSGHDHASPPTFAGMRAV
jgi:hypothetical protein